MCGIHGVINKRSYASTAFSNFIKDGFVAGSLRGMDSSGVFQVDKKKDPYLLKLVLPGPQFIESKVAGQFMQDAAGSPLTVCHVRAATHGKVTADNAHPFTAFKENGKRIIGVHNGTLQGWQYKKGGALYDVDSEWAMNQIALHGKQAFETFQGAWAMVWWDEEEPEKLYVARNSERPLHFLMSKAEDALLFASEAGMLGWLAERNRFDCEDKMYQFENGKLYTIDFSQSKISWTKEAYPVYKTTQYQSAAGGASCGVNYSRGGKWNASRGRYEHEYDDDVYGDGMMGYYGHQTNQNYEIGSPNSRGVGGKGGKTTELSNDGKEVINGIKAVLADNRDARFQRGKYATKTDTAGKPAAEGKKTLSLPAPPKKEEAAATATSEDDLRSDDFTCRPDWYTSASATIQEREAARTAGLMGELQCFRALGIYEPETGECYGEIEDYIPGTGKVKYDAIIRNLSARAAQTLENRPNGSWVAVIGMTEPDKYKGRFYIVTPINSTGLDALNKRAA